MLCSLALSCQNGIKGKCIEFSHFLSTVVHVLMHEKRLKNTANCCGLEELGEIHKQMQGFADVYSHRAVSRGRILALQWWYMW